MDFTNTYLKLYNTHACIIFLLIDIRRYYKFKLYNTYVCIYVMLILYNIFKCVILEELNIDKCHTIYIYTETLLFLNQY